MEFNSNFLILRDNVKWDDEQLQTAMETVKKQTSSSMDGEKARKRG